MFVVGKLIVKEGPTCVIHGENDSQLIFMNSNLLNYNLSKEWGTNLSKLLLGAMYIHRFGIITIKPSMLAFECVGGKLQVSL
jgi:hypothetical protein